MRSGQLSAQISYVRNNGGSIRREIESTTRLSAIEETNCPSINLWELHFASRIENAFFGCKNLSFSHELSERCFYSMSASPVLVHWLLKSAPPGICPSDKLHGSHNPKKLILSQVRCGYATGSSLRREVLPAEHPPAGRVCH